MASPDDSSEQDGMAALCFEKNTFLDVVLLPEGISAQPTHGHRRCRSDPRDCAMPKEVLALSGNVDAWPEFNIGPQGMAPASDQETFRERSVATPTIDASAIKCKSELDTVEWASEASTVEWQTQQEGKCADSPVSGCGRQGTAVAEWVSEAGTVDWQNSPKGRLRSPPNPSAESGSQGSTVVVWAGLASTVEWQSQNGVRCPNFTLPIAQPGGQSGSVGWAGLRQTHASSLQFGGIRSGMDQPYHRQSTYSGASVGIINQQHGNITMPENLVGNGVAHENNHTAPPGSIGHAEGTCLPCAHVWRIGGCNKGDQCKRCHLCGKQEFLEYRKDHRRFMRAVRRAERRGQINVADMAVATEMDVFSSNSNFVR